MVKFVLSILEGDHRILLSQDFMQEILLILFMSVLDLIRGNWSNVKNILIGAGIIECTKKKDEHFVSKKQRQI